MHYKRLLPLLLTLSFTGMSSYGNAADDIALSPSELAFVKQYSNDKLSPNELTMRLKQAQKNQSVIDAITRPWEAKPWYQYYPIFLTDKRLQAGLAFWQKYQTTIERAAKRYQVNPEIIVAIIGIETFYGEYKGKYKVLDSLYTLGFHYPPRGRFFRKELANLLQLAKEEQLSLESLQGSYAGAMGYGQFIPSSYRHYAVDFDNDGKRDLINNPVDAIGSVANYFHRHGWQEGEAVAIRLNVTGNQAPKVQTWNGAKPQLKVAEILSPELSLMKSQDIDINQKGLLIDLKQANGKEYWLGLHNFYVITRYNHSPLYAMAAYQFSQQLKTAYETL